MPPKSKSKSKAKKSPPKPPTGTTVRPAHIQPAVGVQLQETMTVHRTQPSVSSIRTESTPFYFPFGNSLPEDLFLHLDVFAPPRRLTTVDALVIGSCDLRHVFHTLAELKRKLAAPSEADTPSTIVQEHLRRIAIRSASILRTRPALNVQFHVSHEYPEVIARSIVVLHAICTSTEPITPTLVRSIAQFWYSLALDPEVAQFWQAQMQACLDRPNDDWLSPTSSSLFPLRVPDPASLKRLKHVWRTWLANDRSLAHLTQARERSLLNRYAAPKSILAYAKSATEHFAATLAMFRQSNKAQITKVKAEAESLVQHGRWFNLAPLDQLAANPTMLVARSDRSSFYAVHHETLPMDGHAFDLRGLVRLEEGMLANLTVWVESLHSIVADCAADQSEEQLLEPPAATTPASTPTRPIQLQFTFNVDHPLSCMESLTLTRTRFDVISTDNLADNCGLLNLLVHSSQLLKSIPTPTLPHIPHVLTTSSCLGGQSKTRQEYIHEMLAMDMHHVPVLLGLQLVELTDGAAEWGSVVDPFSWSKAHTVGLGKRTQHRFAWMACPVPSAPVNLGQSRPVLESLLLVAGAHCGSTVEKVVRSAGPMTTSALFGTIIARAIASNRITWAATPFSPADPSWPSYQVPESFWDWLVLFKDTIGDMSMHAQLQGLDISTSMLDEHPLPDFALYAKGTFVLAFDTFPSPNLTVVVKYAGREYHTESLRVMDVNHKSRTIEVAFYLPGFMATWDPRAFKIELHRPHVMERGPGEIPMMYYAPMAKCVLTLDRFRVRRVPIHESMWLPITRAIAESTKAAIEARHEREEEGEARLVNVVDAGATFLAVLDVGAYGDDFEVAPPTREQTAAGRGALRISINGRLHTFWLPCPVSLKAANPVRTSRTIQLVLAKQLHAFAPKAGLLGLPFHQRLRGFSQLALDSLKPAQLANKSGAIFTNAEAQFKRGVSKALQGAGRIMAVSIKDVLQSIFAHAIKGHKTVLLTQKADDSPADDFPGFLGIILINGLYEHPPARSEKTSTLALDVAFTVFPPPTSLDEIQKSQEYFEAIQVVMDAVVTANTPMVTVQGGVQAEAVADLFELTKVQCGNRDELPYPLIEGKIMSVPPAARRYLHRGIVTPLGPAADLVKEVYQEPPKAPGRAAAAPARMAPSGRSDQKSVSGQ